MTSLFIRFSAAILVAVLLSFVIDLALFDRSMQRQFEEAPPPFLGPIENDVRRELGGVAVADLPAEIERAEAETGLPFDLLTLDDPGINDAHRPQLAAGQATHDMNFRPGPITYVPLHGDHVVVVGPVALPQPDARDATLMLLVIIVVVGLTSLVVAYPQARRLRALEKATAGLAAGQLDARVRMRGGGPIADVGRRFDEMADTIRQLFERQRELVQAVAHEIRTPISRIRYGLEMAAITEDPEERSRCEAGVDEDLTELDELVAELLVFCRYDEGTLQLSFEETDAQGIVDKLVQRQRGDHPDLEINLEVRPPTLAFVHPRSFQRAIRNVLLNAARHAKGNIAVRVEGEGETVVVEVGDDGPGVPRGLRDRIFEPFARTDGSRSREAGGVGLGLAIVGRILTAHEATVEVGESSLGGARFTTRWPRSVDS